MNNKILMRIISLVMAASVVLAVGGCGKKGDTADVISGADASNGTTKASVQEVIDGKGAPVQPSVDEKASTAVVKYTSVNAEGKSEDATRVVKVDSPIINDLTMSTRLSETIKNDAQKVKLVNTMVDNGVDKSKAEDIVKNAEKWVEFGYTAYIANTSSQRLITSFLELTNSNNNLVVLKNLDCEYGIKSGSGVPVYISGLVNVDKYPDEETIIKELNDMKVKLVYTLVDDSITDIDNWDSVTKKTMAVKFG